MINISGKQPISQWQWNSRHQMQIKLLVLFF